MGLLQEQHDTNNLRLQSTKKDISTIILMSQQAHVKQYIVWSWVSFPLLWKLSPFFSVPKIPKISPLYGKELKLLLCETYSCENTKSA